MFGHHGFGHSSFGFGHHGFGHHGFGHHAGFGLHTSFAPASFAPTLGHASFGHGFGHLHSGFAMGPVVHSEYIPSASGFSPSSPTSWGSFGCQPLDIYGALSVPSPFFGHPGAAVPPPPPPAGGPPAGARGGVSSPAGPDRAYLPPAVGREMGISGYTAASPDGGAPDVRPILRGGGKVGDPIPDPIDKKNAIGFTALHDAIKCGNLARVQELVEAGADLTLSGGPYEMYPLHLAAINGHPEVLAYLLSRGCDVTLTNQIGSTALVCSRGHSSRGGPECAALLEAAMREKGLL